jgi:hypothetical protein
MDFVIYSSYLIDSGQLISDFDDVVARWQLGQPTCQLPGHLADQVACLVLYLASNLGRWPSPARNQPFLDREQSACFAAQQRTILKVSNSHMSSVTPTGKFIWRFVPIEPTPEPFTLCEDASICELVPIAIEDTHQGEFQAILASYCGQLYDSHLKSFGIEADLCQPRSFDSSNSVPLSLNPSKRASVPASLPSRIGFASIGFMTSLNCFQSSSVTGFPPPGQGLLGDPLRLDLTYRYEIACSLVTAPGATSRGHFDDFKSGLGFLDETGTKLVYHDCRHDITFRWDQSPVSAVAIFWADGMSEEQLLQSYDPTTVLRIEIRCQMSGLFNVRTMVKGSEPLPIVKECLVSKRALPVFVLSQILAGSHLQWRAQGDDQRPVLTIGESLRACITKFFGRPRPFVAEKTLYEST